MYLGQSMWNTCDFHTMSSLLTSIKELRCCQKRVKVTIREEPTDHHRWWAPLLRQGCIHHGFPSGNITINCFIISFSTYFRSLCDETTQNADKLRINTRKLICCWVPTISGKVRNLRVSIFNVSVSQDHHGLFFPLFSRNFLAAEGRKAKEEEEVEPKIWRCGRNNHIRPKTTWRDRNITSNLRFFTS